MSHNRFVTSLSLLTLCGIAAAEPPAMPDKPSAAPPGGVQAPANMAPGMGDAPVSAAPAMSRAAAAAWRMGVLEGGRISMPQAALYRGGDGVPAGTLNMGATAQWSREAGAAARTIQSVGNTSRHRMRDGSGTVFHEGQALTKDGKAVSREAAVMQDGATRTRTATTTLPDGSQVVSQDQWTNSGGVMTHTSSTTGPNGNTSTAEAKLTRDGNAVTRDASRTLANGETVQSTDTWTKDGNTVCHEGKSESSSGKTATRASERKVTRSNCEYRGPKHTTQRGANASKSVTRPAAASIQGAAKLQRPSQLKERKAADASK